MANPKMKIVVGAENQARGPLRSVSDDIAGLSRQAQTTNDKLASLGAGLGSWATGIAVAFAANEVRRFAADSIQAFSNLSESVNKSQVVFKGAAGTIAEFAKTSVSNLGMSKQAATEAAGTFGNLFTSMGLGVKQSADMSVGLVKLAADLASFNNIDPSVALEKLRAGMVGEVEPLRALGINLSAAAVNAKAFEMGLAKAGETVSTAGLLQARYALALEQSSNAQGDFARTADGLANSQRIAAAATEDLKAALGALVAQPYTIVIQTVTQGVTTLTEMLNRDTAETKMTTAAIEAQQAYQAALAETTRAYEHLALAQRVGFGVDAAQKTLELAQAQELEATATLRAWNAVLLAKDGYTDIGLATQRLAEDTNTLTAANERLATSFFQIPASQSWMYPSLPQSLSPDFGTANEGLFQTGKLDTAANADQLRSQKQMAEEWQRAQETANTKAASQWQQAYSAQISKVEGILDQGMTTSIKLQDMRPGGAGGIGNDPNGPFAEIYRLQAWINDGTWAETAEKFGVKDKAQGAEIVKKFQTGMWDESVTKMIDEDKIKAAVLTEKQAEAFKKAFTEKIADVTGVGTDVVSAAIWGGDYTDTGAQTKKMTDTGQGMAGGLIAGIVKAQPDLEKEGYNAALAYKKGWNDGMNGKPPTGPTSAPTSSGYKKTGRETGAE